MSLTKTRGVVLRTINLKESDRIIEIYSEDLGKVRAVAKGVRKIQSRMAGHLEPFTYVDLMLARGRGDLSTITGAKAIEHYAALRRDLDAVAVASYLAELVSRLTPDGQASRRFPMLLRHGLRALDNHHEPKRVAAYFEWQAITIAGWEPQLYHCANCYQPLQPEDLSFSITLPGVLCRGCVSSDPEAVSVSPETIKLLRYYSERTFNEVEGLMVHKAVRQETQRLVDRVVRQTLEREPRSKAFLNHLERV